MSAAGAKYIGQRRVEHYCQGGYGEEEVLEGVIGMIRDCAAVFVAKVGLCPKKELAAAGIEPVEEYAFEYIETSLLAWLRRQSADAGQQAAA